MTKPLDPYSRIYWKVLNDDRFKEVRSDMRHFGSWALMLVVADMAYPAPAFVPPTIPKASLRKLIDVGLVETLGGGLFHVHGLPAERAKRSPRGTDPEPDRTPPGPASEPSGDPAGTDPDPLARAIDETRRDEKETRTRQDKTKGSPRRLNTPRATNGEPLLTKEQLDSWKSFGHGWDAFKDVWLGRGFLYPPFGDPTDDDTSQRGLLWAILDARPTDLVRWVKEAPGSSTTEVIGYVIGHWHTIRDEAEPTVPVIAAHGPNRREPPEPVGAILPRVIVTREPAA